MRQTLGVLVGILLSTSPLVGQSGPSIQGAWRLIEVTTSGRNGSTNSMPQPSLYIFSARHYSITRVTAAEPRPEFKDPANVTDAESLAAWGPFQAQAGAYEISGDSLKLGVIISKNPQLMRTGLQPAVFTFALDGNTLTLIQKADQAGRPIANPATFKLVRQD